MKGQCQKEGRNEKCWGKVKWTVNIRYFNIKVNIMTTEVLRMVTGLFD